MSVDHFFGARTRNHGLRRGFLTSLTAFTLLMTGTGGFAYAEEPVVPPETTIQLAAPEESAPAAEQPAAAAAAEPAAAVPEPVAAVPEPDAPAAPPAEPVAAVAEEPVIAAPARSAPAAVMIAPLSVDTTFWPYAYNTLNDQYGEIDSSVYTRGSKEGDLSSWQLGAPSAVGDGDIVAGYVGTAYENGNPMLYVGVDRLTSRGAIGFFLELNQLPNTTNGYGTPIPNRSAGDLRFRLPALGDSFSQPTVQRWTGSGWADVSIVFQFQSSAGTAEFKFNVADLTGSAGFNCSDFAFNSFYLRSAAAPSDSSELKDFLTGPIVADFCADLSIEKRDQNGYLLAGATFAVTPDPVAGTAGPLTVVDNMAPDADPTDGVILLADVEPGTYTVTETVAPTGYLLPAQRSQTLSAGVSDWLTFTFVDPMIWQSPTITKTVVGTFGVDYLWSLDKKGNGEDAIDAIVRAGNSYDIDYTIDVEFLARRVGNYALGGVITVANPNSQAMAVTLSDQLDSGLACTIVGGNEVTAPAGESTYAYTCVDGDLGDVALQGSNRATLTYSNADYPATQGQVDDPATAGTTTVSTAVMPYEFTANDINRTVTVTDRFNGGDPVTLGTVTANPGEGGTVTLMVSGAGEHSIDGHLVTFDAGSRRILPTAGRCESVTNTAGILDLTDTVEAQVCADADLAITKTVTGSYDMTHHWSIMKSVDPARTVLRNTTDTTLDYMVFVDYDGATTSSFVVQGDITIDNPNDWAKAYSVADEFAGTSCLVTDPSGMIPANDSVTLPYTCAMPADFEPGSQDANVAEVTFVVAGETDSVESAPAIVTWDVTDINNPVTITDTLGLDDPVMLGTITVRQDGSITASTGVVEDPRVTFMYSKDVTGVLGECVTFDNTARIMAGETVLDSDYAGAEVCAEADLMVTKTVDGSYTLTNNWSIDKTVDPASTEIIDGNAHLVYEVVLTHQGATMSDFMVDGEITIVNDNAWTRDYSVTDVFAGNGCQVEDAEGTIAPNSSLTLEYTCDVPAWFGPGDEDSNIAAVTSTTLLDGPVTVESDEAMVEWDVTEHNNPVTVADVFGDEEAVALGSVGVDELGALTAQSELDPVVDGRTVTYTYPTEVEVPMGECLTVVNTALVMGDDDVVLDEDAAESELCAEAELVITKTAEAEVDVEYLWKITKDAAKADFGLVQPGSVLTAEYVVTATPDGLRYTRSEMTGVVTLTNPNKYKSVDVTVTDLVSDDAWDCTLADDEMTIAAGETVQVSYTCTLSEGASPDDEGTNRATVSWESRDGTERSVDLTVGYDVTRNETNWTIHVSDIFNNDDASVKQLGTAEWNAAGQATRFEYSREITASRTPGKVTLDNVAWIVETGQKDGATVRYEVAASDKPAPARTDKPGLPRTGVAGTAPWAVGTALMALAAFMVRAARREEES